MKSLYDSILTGISEALEDAKGEEKKLTRNTILIMPVKKYGAKEVQNIRKNTGLSQRLFAGYMGVSTRAFHFA